RLVALPILPKHDPEEAAAEVLRAAELGHRGVQVAAWDVDCGDPAWDPMWRAAEEAGLPVSFHIGGGVRFPVERGTWRSMAFATVVAMEVSNPFVSVVFSGVLDRHPGLTLVLAEAGLGWVP